MARRSTLSWTALLDRLQADSEARTAGANSTDADAWAEFGDRLQQIAEISARSMDLERADAEDIAQDLLLRFHNPEQLERLRKAGSPRGYLFAAARNAGRTLYRRRAQCYVSDVTSEWAPDRSNESVEILEQQVELRELLETLPKVDRELLRLRFWEGLSIAELAERRRVSYSAIAVRLHRLVRRLRDSYRP